MLHMPKLKLKNTTPYTPLDRDVNIFHILNEKDWKGATHNDIKYVKLSRLYL